MNNKRFRLYRDANWSDYLLAMTVFVILALISYGAIKIGYREDLPPFVMVAKNILHLTILLMVFFGVSYPIHIFIDRRTQDNPPAE